MATGLWHGRNAERLSTAMSYLPSAVYAMCSRPPCYQPSTSLVCHLPQAISHKLLLPVGIALAGALYEIRGETRIYRMSRTQWLLLGAILLGLAIAVYIILCPTNCH